MIILFPHDETGFILQAMMHSTAKIKIKIYVCNCDKHYSLQNTQLPWTF
jgi:hypothetical protein